MLTTLLRSLFLATSVMSALACFAAGMGGGGVGGADSGAGQEAGRADTRRNSPPAAGDRPTVDPGVTGSRSNDNGQPPFPARRNGRASQTPKPSGSPNARGNSDPGNSNPRNSDEVPFGIPSAGPVGGTTDTGSSPAAPATLPP